MATFNGKGLKRAGSIALRFFALAVSFALLKFAAPAAERALASPGAERVYAAIVAVETGVFAVKPAEETKTDEAPPEADSEEEEKPERETAPEESLFYVPPEKTVPPAENDAVETTITGEKSSLYLSAEGLFYNNKTEYDIDVGKYLSADTDISADSVKVLIIHTHGSECYSREEGDTYEESDHSRTTDKNYNVVRVGDALEEVLTARGISVIHDRELYDYPNYNGAYTRSYEAIQRNLAEEPDIGVVIDLHRDALESDDGTVYKTVAEVNGKTCSQVMIISGTNYSGLDHPNWEKNLTFAFHLQKRMSDKYPSLARPLKISQYRYNQQATTGSLIVEVGCNGNTLTEAVNAARYFGDCLAAELGK